MEGLAPEAYSAYANYVLGEFARPAAVTTASDVAETVFQAATDVTGRLRFPAGPDAVALAQAS
jgi:hypothetical protein